MNKQKTCNVKISTWNFDLTVEVFILNGRPNTIGKSAFGKTITKLHFI